MHFSFSLESIFLSCEIFWYDITQTETGQLPVALIPRWEASASNRCIVGVRINKALRRLVTEKLQLSRHPSDERTAGMVQIWIEKLGQCARWKPLIIYAETHADMESDITSIVPAMFHVKRCPNSLPQIVRTSRTQAFVRANRACGYVCSQLYFWRLLNQSVFAKELKRNFFKALQ